MFVGSSLVAVYFWSWTKEEITKKICECQFHYIHKKLSLTNLFCKYEQTWNFLPICLHFLMKSLKKNLITNLYKWTFLISKTGQYSWTGLSYQIMSYKYIQIIYTRWLILNSDFLLVLIFSYFGLIWRSTYSVRKRKSKDQLNSESGRTLSNALILTHFFYVKG